MTFCTKCQTEKSEEDFYRNSTSWCKSCRIVASAENYRSRISRDPAYKQRRNADFKSRKKWHVIKNKYGVTKGEYESLLSSQNGVCAVCKCTPDNSARSVLHVDHDHVTGKVRGLLCHLCNFALGSAKDNPETLLQLAAYVTPKFNFNSRLEG